MSPGEKLDPIPDSFILQPPVFHPVSSCPNLGLPGLSAPPFPPGRDSSQGWGGDDLRLGSCFPRSGPGFRKALLSLAQWLSS